MKKENVLCVGHLSNQHDMLVCAFVNAYIYEAKWYVAVSAKSIIICEWNCEARSIDRRPMDGHNKYKHIFVIKKQHFIN